MCACVTSVLLDTDTVMPFSLGMLLELLFGELGPEPGALLHAESETRADTQIKHTRNQQQRGVKLWASRLPLTCHVERAFLGGGDGAVSATQQRTAPTLAHLLLQPGAQLQVGLRGWKKIEKRPNSFFQIQFELCYRKCINTLMKKALISYWNEKKLKIQFLHFQEVFD